MEEKKPLYIQIADAIVETYQDLTYYEPLPGERELCEIFHASRPTIRKAMDVIEKEGKISRIPGKGTFYTGNKAHIDHQLNSIVGLFNDSKQQGRTVTSKILIQNIETPTKEVAKNLELSDDELVFHLERLRYIDGKLYSLNNSFHPLSICPDLRNVDFTNTSLYSTFENMGIHLNEMHQVLEVKPADAYQAMQLEISQGEPVMIRSCITYDTEGRIIEYLKEVTQAYTSKFEMTVYRN